MECYEVFLGVCIYKNMPREKQKLSVKNGEKRGYKRDKLGRFAKGTAPGPGRKRRDFIADFNLAIREIAGVLKTGKEPEKIYIELVKQGIKQGLKGNYNFWRDIADRIYGKETEKIEHIQSQETIISLEKMLEQIIKSKQHGNGE